MLLTRIKLHLKGIGPNSLADIVKLPLLRKLPPKRVAQIWRTHYQQRSDRLGECLDKSKFEKLTKNGSVCRFFALPLRRQVSSFLTFFLSFVTPNTILLTPLSSYLHISNSLSDNLPNNTSKNVPFVLVKFYDELKDSHDLVLVRIHISNPHFNNNSNILGSSNNVLTNNNIKDNKLRITKSDALRLFGDVILFYSDFNRFRWVEQFNRRPREFEFGHFLKQNNDLFQIN